MSVRRVATGHDAGGKSVVASDARLAPVRLDLLPGYAWTSVWCEPKSAGFFPPPGGHRFLVFEVPPDSTARPPVPEGTSLYEELERALPGMAPHMERDGMHASATIDYGYIASGEVWLELDGGRQVHLRAGDTYVQNGTRHAWRNKSSASCTIVVVLIGVAR
jgi:mannose-6-phosphate isomerase-like protein (cupin superfamily)